MCKSYIHKIVILIVVIISLELLAASCVLYVAWLRSSIDDNVEIVSQPYNVNLLPLDDTGAKYYIFSTFNDNGSLGVKKLAYVKGDKIVSVKVLNDGDFFSALPFWAEVVLDGGKFETMSSSEIVNCIQAPCPPVKNTEIIFRLGDYQAVSEQQNFDVTSDWQTFDFNNYSIKSPVGMIIRQDYCRNSDCRYSISNDYASARGFVLATKIGIDELGYINERKKFIQQPFKDIKHQEIILGNNIWTKVEEFADSSTEKLQLRTISYIIESNNRLYSVSIRYKTGEKPDYEYIAWIEKILSTIEFEVGFE